MKSIVQTKQKLAAIMFTDIISFSVMTSRNEKKALAILQEHNRLLCEQFSIHNGNVIKETGDGYLAEFSSSLESVNAAIAIQHSLYVHNSTREIDDQIRIRIGIHLGDIVKTDSDDILGDGVNIASRIEPHSEPNGGGLCFSQQIYDQVHNKINYDIDSIGKKKLKGITKPYELYRVILPFQKSNIRSVGERKVKNSIAVLPFVNMSSDEENEYFADGITESLLNVMAKEKELKVISRTSAFSYKGKDIPTKQIGRELNVEHILEGSVRKSGNKVRITAQFIQVADDFHLWSETYDRTDDDIFTVQDEIASKILTQLLDRLISCDTCNSTNNAEVFELYHKGRYYWNNRTRKDLEKAIEYFEKCLEIDSEFSLAYCGLIDAWYIQRDRFYEKKDIILSKCKDAIKKLDSMGADSSAEYLSSKSRIFHLEGNEDKTVEYLNAALDENPNLPSPHHWLSIWHSESGRYDEAIEEIEKAVSLDPKSPIILCSAAWEYSRIGNVEKQKDFILKTSELMPGFQSVEIGIGEILQRQNKWKEALEYFNKLYKQPSYSEYPENKFNLIACKFYHHLITNQNEIAKELLNELEILFNSNGFNKIFAWYLGFANMNIANFHNAYKYYSILIEHFPEPEIFYIQRAQALICMEKYDQAFNDLNKAETILKNIPWDNKEKLIHLFDLEFSQTLAHIKMEDLEEAYLGINKLKNYKSNYININFNRLYKLYFLLGDVDKGFEYYNKFFKEQKLYEDLVFFDIIYNPWCQSARSDKRYIEILKKIKLYDYWKDSM